MYIVSGCLLGHDCKYDGGNNANEDILLFALKEQGIFPVQGRLQREEADWL